MARNLGISFVIGAALSQSFGPTLGDATRKVGRFDQAIKDLERGRGDIERFRKLKREVGATEVALREAQDKAARLAREMRESGQASASMRRSFESARKQASALKDKLADKRGELHRLRGEMQGAGVDTSKLEGRYRELGASLDRLKGRQAVLGRIAEQQERLAGKRAEFRSRITDVVAMGVALGGPIKAAMGFESAMADVKKVVSFEEPDGLVKLGSALKSMSRRIPLNPDELAQIAAAGGQLGVAAEKLPLFTETVAKMATAFDMTADKAGETAAKVANVWGVPIERIGSLGDAINHLSDNTAAKAPEMLEVLQRVGGTAKIFGLSATQAAALGNAFVALGKTPEVASTGINAMLNRLMTADKQGKEFQGSLKQLGWTAKSLKQAIGEDAQGGLDKFLESLTSVDESKRMGILTGLFGMEFADDISVLVGSLDQYRKAQNLVGQETQYAGSMQREFESRAATSEAKVRLLGNVVTTLGINLGTVLLPGINYVVGALANAVGWVADFAERNETLTRIVGGLAAGILGVGIASFILGYAWTFVQGGALLVAKSVMFIGKAFQIMGMALAGNPIGLVLAGLALAAGLVMANWDSVKKWLGKAWDWIVEKAGWVGEKVKKYLGWLFDEQEGGELGVAVADGPKALEAPESAQVPQLGAAMAMPAGMEANLGGMMANLPMGLPVDVAKASADAIPISPAAMPVSAGGVTINYQPTFQITGANDPSAVRGQVEQALAMDQRELRRMIQEELNRARNEERRLSFG